MSRRELIYRHPLAVRITHWINALCLLLLLSSGLQIFNAHPALYWGSKSVFDAPFFALRARDAGNSLVGEVVLLGKDADTTGWLGAGPDKDGDIERRGFPWWATLPGYRDLATGRRWHFFFAWVFVLNGLVYLLYSMFSGHLRRDLAPSGAELRGIGASLGEHLRLRFPKGEAARRYNVLQKLSYLAVALIVLPLMLLTGLAMSPGLDAAYPILLDAFGGRQSARTIHFIAASLLVLFVAVHIFMVLISGVWNNMRAMVTGRYAIEREEAR